MIFPMVEQHIDDDAVLAILSPLNDALNRVTQAYAWIWYSSRYPEMVDILDRRVDIHTLGVDRFEHVDIQRLIEELAKEPAGVGVDGILRAAARINPPPPPRSGRKKKGGTV